MNKVSIICTAYNAEQYIQQSLDSVFDQSFKDFELILVDDGSTDETHNVMLQNKRENVKILRNKHNEGIPVSRNKAILECSGDYIAIQDADDISLPNRLEKEVSILDHYHDVVFLGTLATKINHSGDTIGNMMVYPPVDTVGAFLLITRYKLNPIIDPSSMFRKDYFLKHGGYSMDPQVKTVLDFDLWCRFLQNGYRMTNIQEPLIKYRINPNGVTRTKNQEMVEATDLVWSKFRRKNLTDPVLRKDFFQQDL